MKGKLKHSILAAAALASCIGAAAARADDCDNRSSLRLVNGKIHTMDASDRIVSTALIANGRFIEVGTQNVPADTCTRSIDLGGRTAVPGIIDSHNHIILLGLRPGRDTRLENANSITEALATLAARANEIQHGEWITSIGGFSRNQFFRAPRPTRFPTLKELSKAVPDHPVFIMEGFSGPGAVNQKAKDFLVANGVPVGTTTGEDEGYVDGGGLGAATPCTTALFLLRKMQTRDSMLQGLQDAMRYAAGIGVTTHLDQGGFPFKDGEPLGDASDGAADFDRYRAHDSVRELYQEGKLTNRIWINFLHVEQNIDTPELTARLLNSWDHFGNDMLHVLGIGEFTASAFFLPGTPAWQAGTRRVAYAQWRNENHSLNFTVPPFTPGAPLDWKVIIDGWQAVNDELTDPANPNRIPDGITKLRWVLAHVPVITTDYLDKLNKLGGGVNVLGGWRWLSGTTDQNGPPFRDILASGIHVGMSSDGMQISTMSPWINLYYVVTGKNARGELINAGQTLGRNDAMRLYTANNGWFLKAEDKLGTIEEGKLGDLVVISGDYFDSRAVPDESIKDLRSVLTVVGGKVVYNDLNGQSQDYWKAGMP